MLLFIPGMSSFVHFTVCNLSRPALFNVVILETLASVSAFHKCGRICFGKLLCLSGTHQVSARLIVAVQVLEEGLSVCPARQQVRDGGSVCSHSPPHLHAPAAATNAA